MNAPRTKQEDESPRKEANALAPGGEAAEALSTGGENVQQGEERETQELSLQDKLQAALAERDAN